MSTSHTNTGIILVPDDCPLTEEIKEEYFLAANYNTTTDEEKEENEKSFEKAPEEIKFYAYLKDGELSSMTMDVSTLMGEGALMGMSIYDVTIEIVALNDKVDTSYPKVMEEATYVSPEEFSNFILGSSDEEM